MWFPYGFLAAFLCFPVVFCRSPYVFLLCSVVFLRFSYGLRVVSDGFHIVFPWFSRGLPMSFLFVVVFFIWFALGCFCFLYMFHCCFL